MIDRNSNWNGSLMEINKTEKNVQESVYELVFNEIAEMPLQEAQERFRAELATRQGVDLITKLEEAKFIVYELQFRHEKNLVSSYQVKLNTWAQDSLTHVQFFRKPLMTELQRKVYNTGILTERLFSALAYALVILSSLYFASYFILALGIFFALRYALKTFKTFKWERRNPFLAEDEAIVQQILDGLCKAEKEEAFLYEEAKKQAKIF
jgi:hypothetical protein